jgi:predicted DNA-binding protein (MmcQ/YjbR family)
MTYEEFNEFCATFPATSYVVQWGGSHVWKVGGKVFAIGGWTKEGDAAFSFKVSELHFNLLSEEPGYRPAPYLASRGMKWIQHYKVTKGTIEDLKYYLSESHKIVASGLSKKKQRELGLLE